MFVLSRRGRTSRIIVSPVERCKGSMELSNSQARRVNKTEDSYSMMAILIAMKPYPKDCWGGSWSHRSHVLPLHPDRIKPGSKTLDKVDDFELLKNKQS